MIKTLQQNPTQLQDIFKHTFVSIQNVKFLAQVLHLSHSNNDKMVFLPCKSLMPLGCYEEAALHEQKNYLCKYRDELPVTFLHWNYCKVIYSSDKK